MSLEFALFLAVAIVTGLAALGVVVSKSIVRSAISLLFTLIGVSLLYFLLGAEFLGAAQLIVYVGGTLVLVVFGGMLTSKGPYAGVSPRRVDWLLGGALAIALFAGLVVMSFSLAKVPVAKAEPLPGVAPLGLTFLGIPDRPGRTSFLLPFEIISVHLLVVLIGSAYLARARRNPAEAPHG